MLRAFVMTGVAELLLAGAVVWLLATAPLYVRDCFRLAASNPD